MVLGKLIDERSNFFLTLAKILLQKKRFDVLGNEFAYAYFL